MNPVIRQTTRSHAGLFAEIISRSFARELGPLNACALTPPGTGGTGWDG
jgi:hypothetical protein